VWLRSSVNPDGVLRWTRAEWDAFLVAAKAGEFDQPPGIKP
jgi:hypothetical protein